MTLTEKIFQNIEVTIKNRGTSKAWVAFQLGVTKVGFYKMFDNKDMKLSTLVGIANVLCVTLTELIETD